MSQPGASRGKGTALLHGGGAKPLRPSHCLPLILKRAGEVKQPTSFRVSGSFFKCCRLMAAHAAPGMEPAACPMQCTPTSLPVERRPPLAPSWPPFMSAAKCAYHCQEAVGIFLMLPRAVPRSLRDCSSGGTQHKLLFTTSLHWKNGDPASVLPITLCSCLLATLTPQCPSCKLCAPSQWRTHRWSSDYIAVGASKAGRHGH